MEDAFIRINDRLAHYTARPDPAFRTESGYKSDEEAVMQKLRQFWADESIPNDVKLSGFELDLADFDPRNTSFNEMKTIGLLLLDLGIVDSATRSGLDYAGVEFDRNGMQINKDKKVNAIAWLHMNLDFLKKEISEGHGYARDGLVKFELALTVMLALEDKSKSFHPDFVDVHV